MATALLHPPVMPTAPPPQPFHLSPAWTACWAEAYAEGRPVCLDLPAGRLDLLLREGRLGPLRFPLLTSATNLQTCYFDAQGGGLDAAAAQRIPERLLALGAAQVRIDWLGEDARLLAAARGWRAAHLVTIDPFARSPRADCGSDFESYLERAGSSLRKYWKACRKYILNGPLRFEIVTGGPGLAPLLGEMFELEASGWKGREGTAILAREDDRRFYTSLAFAAAEAGALRIAALREDGRLLAFEYCILGGDSVLALKVGYDETRSRIQPGHLVAMMNIRDACADPAIRWYDLLGNGMRVAEYKRRFATDYLTLHRVRLFARTPLGYALYALYRCRPAAKALRDRVGALAKLRRR